MSRKRNLKPRHYVVAAVLAGLGIYAYKNRDNLGPKIATLIGKEPVAIAAGTAKALPAPAASGLPAELVALWQSSITKWRAGDKTGSEVDYQAAVKRSSKAQRQALIAAYGNR